MDLEEKGQRALMVGGYHQLLKESVYPAGRFSGSFCTAKRLSRPPCSKVHQTPAGLVQAPDSDRLARTYPARRRIFEHIMKLYRAPAQRPDREIGGRDMPYQ